jgi:hypothetical protein
VLMLAAVLGVVDWDRGTGVIMFIHFYCRIAFTLLSSQSDDGRIRLFNLG